jgi:hypothetical protein
MTQRFVQAAVLITLIAGSASLCHSQTSSELNTYFQQNVGLTQDQIASIRGGQAVAKVAKSRIPDEIFVFVRSSSKRLRNTMSNSRMILTAFARFPDTRPSRNSAIPRNSLT